MELDRTLKQATFVKRLNRFSALVVCDGREVLAHVANSGRLRELLSPHNQVFLSHAVVKGRQRKTAYTLALVEVGGVLVSADARLPPALLRDAIQAGRLPPFAGYEKVSTEVPLGDSRVDLLLSGGKGSCYIEAKSVTLVEGGVGLFPDAPTLRGRKHLRSLAEAVRAGHRAAVVFVIQRPDAVAFAPNEAADPLFCQALRQAIQQGVEAYACRCHITMRQVQVADLVPVHVAPDTIIQALDSV